MSPMAEPRKTRAKDGLDRFPCQTSSFHFANLGLVHDVAQEKKYTKDHEWVELSDDGKMGTIGISTYAAHSLGDVVYVELPQIPMDVSGGDAIGAVESVKSASDIMTPISGNIVEANTKLEETPGLINREPEGATGWIAKIEIGEKGKSEWEGEELMGAEEYKSFTEE
ncbi:MAG: hypothetical protein M1837_002514 [Sclerophora amabilis]|nr:MAG: hypothetical protein M1837_002514 [Sclerophora amabilis]